MIRSPDVSAREPKSSRRSYGLVCIALAAALGAAAGCGAERGGSGGTVDKDTRRQQQFQELMGRPDIEQAAQRYSEIMGLLRGRLESELGVARWYEDAETGSNAGCHEFPDVDGRDKQSRGLRFWVSDGNVPDEKWGRLVEITQEIIRTYDFETPPRVIVDRPGDHQITAADPFGADLILGTKVNTVLRVRTGCHLTAAARQRGMPTIPEYGRQS
jgi:hypothetical protein